MPLPQEIDPKAPDAQARGAALFKQVLLDDVTAYVTGGPGVCWSTTTARDRSGLSTSSKASCGAFPQSALWCQTCRVI